MDQNIEGYINSFIQDALTSEFYANLSEAERGKKTQEIREHFLKSILSLLVDLCDPEQLEQLKTIQNPDSEEAQTVVMDIASHIPHFAEHVEDILEEEAEKIKNTGKIPQTIE